MTTENGDVVFSARQLAHVLGMRWCGKSTANSLHEQIEVLSNTSLSWLFMFVRVKGMTVCTDVFRLLQISQAIRLKV